MSVPRSTWKEPPAALSLSLNTVHVWRARLDVSSDVVTLLERTLAPDETRRADRFHFERDRLHFVVARGVLRLLLGRYLDCSPAGLPFRYGPYGKPELAPREVAGRVQFNMSHSGGLALFAIAEERQVGVDVEFIRAELATDGIAKRFFSAHEAATLQSLPPDLRLAAFFHCWTRKEAYIKATGKGLSIPLDQFDVSLSPFEPARLLATRWNPGEADRWSLHTVPAGSNYIAALAVEGHGCHLEHWEWSEACCGRWLN